MKTVNEIKDIGAMFATDPSRAFAKVTEALIGITEHLEAQEKPCAGVQIGKFMDEGLRGEVRREAMIEALRWADRVTQSGGVEYSAIGKAIARLENGGDL